MTAPAPRLVSVIGPVADSATVIELPRAMTVADAIAANGISFRLPTIAVLSGGRRKEPVPVLRKDWARRKIKRGETLTLVAVPGRGGSGQGKQIGALIATIALSIAAPWAGAQVAGALFAGSTFAGAIASTAFMAGGGLVNIQFAGGGVVGRTIERTYGATRQTR